MKIKLYDATGLIGYADVPPQVASCICNGRLFETTGDGERFTVQENVPNVTLLAVDGTPMPRIHATGGNMPGHDSQGRPLDALPNDMSSLPIVDPPSESLIEREARLRKLDREASGR